MKNLINKGTKGITLIALVVTIVILIILAGVLVNITLGDNGLFTRAKLAKEKYEYAEAKEIVDIKLLDIQAECYSEGKEYTLDIIADRIGDNNEVSIDIIKFYPTAKLKQGLSVPEGTISGIVVIANVHPQYEFLIGKEGNTIKIIEEQNTPTTYTITYNLAGGTVATPNPSTYTTETATFTLVNPTKAADSNYQYEFAGWTGTDLESASTTVQIGQGSTGNRSYTATWTATPRTPKKGTLSEDVEYTTYVDDTDGIKLINEVVKEVVYDGTQFVAVTEENKNSGEHFYIIGETTEGKTMLLAKYCLSKTENAQVGNNAEASAYTRKFSYSRYWSSSKTTSVIDLQTTTMLNLLNNQSDSREKDANNNAIIKAQEYASNFGSDVISRLMSYEEANKIHVLGNDNSINVNSLKSVFYCRTCGEGENTYTMTDGPTQGINWWLGSGSYQDTVWFCKRYYW